LETFKEFVLRDTGGVKTNESTDSIAIPTKIAGFKEDYIILITDIIEIFDSEGEYIVLDKKDYLYKSIEKIVKNSEEIEYDEYKEEYDHYKYYKQNDWDSETVIPEPKGLDKIIGMISKRFQK
jgi:hypothetical protein